MKLWCLSFVCLLHPSMRGIYAFSSPLTSFRPLHQLKHRHTKIPDTFTYTTTSTSTTTSRGTSHLTASIKGGENIRITDIEAELIARKLREEQLIDLPMIPNYMEKQIITFVLKVIIEKVPLYLPETVFYRLVAGEGGLEGLEESIVRQLTKDIYVPFLPRTTQEKLVEQLCDVLFTPKSFKTVKRQMLSRAQRDFLNTESRTKLATDLNALIDIPFLSETQEQTAAETFLETAYDVLERVIPKELLEALDSTSPEEIQQMRTNLIDRLAETIHVPLVSDEKEEEVLTMVVDVFLSYWGLQGGSKRPEEQIVDTEHALRQVEIELEALTKITEQQLTDLRTNQDRLRNKLTSLEKTVCPPPTLVENVHILKDADAVGDTIRHIVAEEAQRAIHERGYFSIAIPGGSILKMLAGDIPNKDDWTSKTTLVYVNHKCVDMEDGALATHAKARKLFLDDWKGVTTIVLEGSTDGQKEAKSYEDQIRALDNDILPIDPESGLPVFDLSLIGVGDDGHIGSLYPGREEVLVSTYGSWVLPVDMKDPPSITLSLPMMKGRKTVVAACGVSDKYPQGKSDGMRRAIAADDETLISFPAVGLRDCASWVLDEMAASKLGEEYQ